MKYAAFFLALSLLAAPVAAQTDGGQANAGSDQKTATPPAPMAKTRNEPDKTGTDQAAIELPSKREAPSKAPARAKKKSVKKSAARKKTVTGSLHKRHARRKRAPRGAAHKRSGAAIVKQGGKTCSGVDEYRVCW